MCLPTLGLLGPTHQDVLPSSKSQVHSSLQSLLPTHVLFEPQPYEADRILTGNSATFWVLTQCSSYLFVFFLPAFFLLYFPFRLERKKHCSKVRLGSFNVHLYWFYNYYLWGTATGDVKWFQSKKYLGKRKIFEAMWLCGRGSRLYPHDNSGPPQRSLESASFFWRALAPSSGHCWENYRSAAEAQWLGGR